MPVGGWDLDEDESLPKGKKRISVPPLSANGNRAVRSFTIGMIHCYDRHRSLTESREPHRLGKDHIFDADYAIIPYNRNRFLKEVCVKNSK